MDKALVKVIFLPSTFASRRSPISRPPPADVLRYSDLKLSFYGHDIHVGVSSSSTVDQYNLEQILPIALIGV